MKGRMPSMGGQAAPKCTTTIVATTATRTAIVVVPKGVRGAQRRRHVRVQGLARPRCHGGVVL